MNKEEYRKQEARIKLEEPPFFHRLSVFLIITGIIVTILVLTGLI